MKGTLRDVFKENPCQWLRSNGHPRSCNFGLKYVEAALSVGAASYCNKTIVNRNRLQRQQSVWVSKADRNLILPADRPAHPLDVPPAAGTKFCPGPHPSSGLRSGDRPGSHLSTRMAAMVSRYMLISVANQMTSSAAAIHQYAG